MGEQKASKCLICDGPASSFATTMQQGVGPVQFWNCDTCGHVICPGGVGGLKISEMIRAEKSMLAAFVRERFLRGNKETWIIEGTLNPGEVLPRHAVMLAGALDLMCDVFASPMQRLNRTLLNIARLSPGLGRRFDINDLGTVYAEDTEAASFVLSALRDSDYILWAPVLKKIGAGVKLTIKGYNRIAELEAERRGFDSDQAFVAMSFHTSMDTAFRDGIAPAIEGAGYKPKRVDQNVTLGKVCEEIIAEIRKSRFLVADFTGHREGVYFEAGFALGLGIPVIWTIQKDSINDLHFDTRQYRHIAWEKAEDLRRQLQVSIEANIPKAPHEP